MKGRWLWFIISANLITLVALIFVYPDLMISPGPLIKAHADLATDCFACHAPLRGASAQRCTTCHAPGGIGVRTTKGVLIAAPSVAGKTPQNAPRKTAFHQELSEQNCMACHSDHAGPKLTQHSRKPFSHQLLRAETRDRCESCHRAPTDTLHRQIQGNCTQCHSSTAWKPASFEHDKFFLLDKDHNATCATCHTAGDFRKYTCYGCHEHTPANVLRKHRKEGIQNFENCVKCHRSADDEPKRGEGGRSEGDRKRERRD
jgi:hypothetical protein